MKTTLEVERISSKVGETDRHGSQKLREFSPSWTKEDLYSAFNLLRLFPRGNKKQPLRDEHYQLSESRELPHLRKRGYDYILPKVRTERFETSFNL